MSDSIQVAIKVRPLIKREKDENLPFQWAVSENIIVPVDPEKKRGEGGFQFDHIFDPQKSNQDVFETVVKPIIDAAVKGFNGTVFAYGQTSSGKTHTMMGTLSEPGIIPLAVNRTFECIAETCNREFLLRVSYLEIYNEKVNDLLDPTGTDLKLREDTNGLVQVLKCKEEIASSPEIILTIMKKGDKNRRIGETDMNERSSRSHTIFRITIESRDQSSDSDGAIQVSQLNLVDLAGSERARQTNATGERFKEGTHINLSLSSLGLVIKQLSEASENSKQHVNFRDSKLTRLLQASLGGNAMTTIICAVTPAAFDETLCTLSFASRAKSVKNKPQLNEVMSDAALLKRYKKQLAKLNEELERLKNEKGIAEVQEMESRLQEKEHKLQETDRINQILEERIELLKTSIISAGAAAATKEDVVSMIPKARRRRTWAGDGRNFQRSSCKLEPIKEDASPEKLSTLEKVEKLSRRKSIIQTVNLNDESFETAFTDFELELIKVAKEREEDIHSVSEFATVKSKSLNRVKFQDDVEIFSLSNNSNYSDAITPEKQKTYSDVSPAQESPSSTSPGTPKKVLRERLSYLTQEYNSLQEFTTLERQTLFVQKDDFGSSNEKIFMQNQIDGLLDRLTKSNLQQTELEEHLSLSCKCIEDFCSLTPDFESFENSLFDNEQRKASVSKLQDLQDLLKNFKNDENNFEKPMTSLEKKLTNDYNQCVQELQQVKLQKEELYQENTELKKQLSDETNKLKNAEILINTLRADTDCLMETLIKKNSELADLKEKVVELERINLEEEKTLSVIHETSTKELKTDISIVEKSTSHIDQDSEIYKLTKMLEEKALDHENYLKNEKELKAENKHLHNTIDEMLENKSNFEENLKTEISELSEMLNCKNERILEYQQLEIEFNQKIEKLQHDLDLVNNEGKPSLISETGNSVESGSNLQDFLATKNIESMTQESQTEPSQVSLNTQECQTETVDVNQEANHSLLITDVCSQKSLSEYNKNEILDSQYDNLQENIKKFQKIIQEKDFEIEKHLLCEENLKKEIEILKTVQDNSSNNLEHFSKDCQTESIVDVTVNKNNCNPENDHEISKLIEIINEKDTEMSDYKNFQEKIKEGTDRLNKLLYDILKVEDSPPKMILENDINYESKKIESELKTSDHVKLFQEEIEVLVKNIQKLSSLNESLKKNIFEKDNKISHLQLELNEKIQALEQKIEIVLLERNQLKEEINIIQVNKNTENYEKERLNLKSMIENLKLENETLKQKLQAYDTEFVEKNSIIKRQEIASPSVVGARVEALENSMNKTVNLLHNFEESEFLPLPKIKTEEDVEKITIKSDETSYSLDDFTKDSKISPEDSFVKPANVLTQDYKDSKTTVQPTIKKLEMETSSIFANETYFDNMTVGQSFAEDFTGLITGLDETKDVTNVLADKNDVMVHQNEKSEPMDVDTSMVIENNENFNQMEDCKSLSPKKETNTNSVEDLKKIKAALEKENVKLSFDLENKNREAEEIQRNVKDFKRNLEELQQTIYVLTNENMDMSKLLTEERDNNKKVINDLQEKIDSLTSRLSVVLDEKVSLKNELSILNEQLDNLRGSTPIITDDELRKKYTELQEKFKDLNEENITLSTELMEKIDELEKVKESKVQLYDHQCTYREKSEALVEKIKALENENIILSTEVTEHIDECDKLKESIDVLKRQLQSYENLKSTENDMENNLKIFKEENTRLRNELIELRSKIVQLNRENSNLSYNMNLDLSNESNKSVNITENKTRDEISTIIDTSFSGKNCNDESNLLIWKEKLKSLQDQVNHLTLANQKLGDLKIPSCNQCTQLKEINQNRRQLKLEINSLTSKHADLQKKFEQKCADIEMLKAKANESFNASISLMDSTLNSSCYDGVNVTFMEEKVRNLHSEVEELKENHNKLSNQYQEKCSELEKLQVENIPNTVGKKESKRSKSDTPSRKNVSRMKSLEKALDNLSNDLKELRKDNENVSSTLHKFIEEKRATQLQIETLEESNTQLKKEYDEKVKLLEDELAALYLQWNNAQESEKEIQAQKLEMDVRLESLLKEKSDLLSSLEDAEEKLKKVLNESKEENNLKDELLKLKEIMKSKNENENYLEQKLQDEIDTAKSRIIKEIRGLESLAEKEIKELPKKPVSEIFLGFLNAIMSKEKEIIKGLQGSFEKTKRKLEEEKQQSIDAEKRANNWARTVEIDLEKCQADLSELELKNQRLQDEIHRLNDNLREAAHENQQLHSSINNLESDINSLHNELDKQLKKNTALDIDNALAQEKEKIARAKDEEWDNRLRMEKENHDLKLLKINEQLEYYQSSNDDLKSTVEGLDLEIKHLKSTIVIKTNEIVESTRKIDLLEHEICRLEEINQQLKHENLEKERHEEEIRGLLKIKCDLLTEYKTKVETIKPEYESLQTQMTERKQCIEKYKEEIHVLNLENKKQADILQDKLSSEEIKSSALNKQLNEYKNKNTALCCTIEEIKDRCSELERENANLQRKVRNSLSKLRVENELQELQDENRSLKNHLEGSYNRIATLQESKSQIERELLEAQGKNELLEQELTTTQITLASMREKYNNFNVQKLREKYESVLIEKNNLVREIEEKKMLIAGKDQKLVEYSIEIDTTRKKIEEFQKKINSMDEEKHLLENKISYLLNDCDALKKKITADNLEKETSYRSLIEEKTKICQELEACKNEKSMVEAKNIELDKEMDEMVDHIHKQENEIAELQDKLITGSFDSTQLDKLKALEESNEKLRIDLRVTEVNRDKLQDEIIKIRSEKELLHRRIDDLNFKINELESKNSSRNSSKNSSPTTQKERRRRRRSDLYCQNRNLDDDSKDFTDNDSPSITPTPPMAIVQEECPTCFDLRNRIREMSLDLVSRNNKITMLEVQLQAENFPYQMKCNELNENLMAVKTRNSELKLENQKLQRALMDDSSRECHFCRQRKLNRREQSVQTNLQNKISLTGMSSGIVEEHLKLEKMEKERNWMKDLCRSRARKIKELEQRIIELESLNTTS